MKIDTETDTIPILVNWSNQKWYFPGLNATFKWLFWIFWRDFWVFWAYKRLKPGNLNCKPPQGASSSTFRGFQPRVGPEHSKIEARKFIKVTRNSWQTRRMLSWMERLRDFNIERCDGAIRKWKIRVHIKSKLCNFFFEFHLVYCVLMKYQKIYIFSNIACTYFFIFGSPHQQISDRNVLR